MQIFVKTFTSETITLDVDAFESVDDVKRKVYDKVDMGSFDQLKLQFAGQ